MPILEEKKLFNEYSLQNSDSDGSLENKLIYILNPQNLNQVQTLGSFIKQSLELRTRDS